MTIAERAFQHLEQVLHHVVSNWMMSLPEGWVDHKQEVLWDLICAVKGAERSDE
jgi:hypothetical protein